VAYDFQTGNNKIKLLTEYECVIQKVLFGNAVLLVFQQDNAPPIWAGIV
jgi:hypothetical protein